LVTRTLWSTKYHRTLLRFVLLDSINIKITPMQYCSVT